MKYYYRYEEKLLHPDIPTPFYFGSAIDETLNYIMECMMVGDDFSMDKVWDIYEKYIRDFRGVDVTKNPNVAYSNSDIDYYLLEEQDIIYFEAIDEDFRNIPGETQAKQLEYTKWFKEEHPEEFQYLGWISLYNKGREFIKVAIDEVLPKIKEITAVQERKTIKNGEGDTLTIISDFRCIMSGKAINEDPQIVCPIVLEDRDYSVLADNKTSSTKYAKDKVETSPQLATYNEFFDNELCAYFVFVKKIPKSKKISWQILINTIPQELTDSVFEGYQEGLDNMKKKIYEKNPKACYAYGRQCEYYSMCKHGKMGVLYKREKK